MFNVICMDEYDRVVTNLTQWDENITLNITGADLKIFTKAPSCHFCNSKSKEALVVDSTLTKDGLTVKIPNILLTQPYTIFLYIYAYGEDDSGKTVETIRIPVRKKSKPKT